jgi:1-phosphofructokinase
MIVTLTPNPSLDRTLFLDTFTRGAVNRCTATLVEPSGKGINVALALHRHGVPALALLPSGGPAGEQLVQLLVTAGLPYRTVTITGTIRTNVSMIEADGTSSKINELGPTLSSDEVTELLRATLDSCSSGDWLSAERILRTRPRQNSAGSAYRRSAGGGRRLWIDAACSAHRYAPTREAERA